ncbi:hypothetical protein KNN17_21195 [Arthrobacter bambusae]|uniref:RraA family protein n=1 Tax=Arthrobacter bambusae TaxID=1338426 RepID=UPI001F5096C8|nr:hypothetical protein [Arthrobacter bambusae]MCI0144074.1 hypothetical protein [Arthrobacter bambusae]
MTGKLPVIGAQHQPRVEGADPSIILRLASHSTADLSDLVGRLYTMTPEIRPLYTPCPRMAGTAVTVRTARGDNQAVKDAVADIQTGDVLVIDAQGFTGWCSGGYGMLRAATADGKLAGVIVNGAYRDIAEFEVAGLPIYGIATSPATGPKLGPGQINVAVSCGNVIINPGDVIIADAEGVIVVPHSQSEVIATVADEKRAS